MDLSIVRLCTMLWNISSMLPLTLTFKYVFIIPWKAFRKIILLWWSFLYLKLECEGWDVSSLCRPFVTANFQFLSMIQWMSGPTNNLRKRQAHLHHNNHSGYHCTGVDNGARRAPAPAFKQHEMRRAFSGARWSTEQGLCARTSFCYQVEVYEHQGKLPWECGRRWRTRLEHLTCLLPLNKVTFGLANKPRASNYWTWWFLLCYIQS